MYEACANAYQTLNHSEETHERDLLYSCSKQSTLRLRLLIVGKTYTYRGRIYCQHTQSQLLGRSFLFLVHQPLQNIVLPRIIRCFLLTGLSLQSSPRLLIQGSCYLIIGSRCFMARWMLAAFFSIQEVHRILASRPITMCT